MTPSRSGYRNDPDGDAPARPADKAESLLFEGVKEAQANRIYTIEKHWSARYNPMTREALHYTPADFAAGERVRVLRVARQVYVDGDLVNYSLVKSIDHPAKRPWWVIDQNLDELKR